MTNFQKITQSPDALGAFLASLPCIEGPWDIEFQRLFCNGCSHADCDSGEPCPHTAERNNPDWWLTLNAAQADKPETHIINLDLKEIEKPLTAEEKAKLEHLRPMFRYFMGKDLETGEIEIGPMNGENRIVLSGPEEVHWFIESLKELI